jgi:hypothetical protein
VPPEVDPVHNRLGLLVAGVSLIAAACSGSAATAAPSAAPIVGTGSAAPSVETSSAPSSGVASAAASSAAPSAASAAPSTAPSAVASAEPSVAASASAQPSFDLGDVTKNLSHLTSYHEEFMQTGGAKPVSAKVTVVRAPKVEERADVISGTEHQQLVLIGSDTWVDLGTGTFVKNKVPAAALQASFNAFDPGVFLRTFQNEVDFAHVPVLGIETKNGVQAVHFHADQSTNLGPGKPTIPPGAIFDLWVSTDNDYLVALEYSGVTEKGSPSSGAIELTQINDPSLSVQAPS